MGKSIKEDPSGNGKLGGTETQKRAKQAIDMLWYSWRNKFAGTYEKIMNKLATSPDYFLTAGEKEFCDRYERNLEFVTPKRAREDGNGNADVGNTVIVVSPQKAKNIDNLLKKM